MEVSDSHTAERGASELERNELAKGETKPNRRIDALEKNIFVRSGKHIADFSGGEV